MTANWTFHGLLTLGSLMAMTALAQPAPGTHRIGFVNVGPAAPNAKNLAALKAGFAELGYVEGKNLELVVRWGEGQPEKLPGAIKEILDTKPRIMLSTGGGVTVKAVNQAAPAMPVVFVTGNPLGEKLVTNLARPGGNITGIAVLAGQLEAKRLEYLKLLVPKIKRVGMIWNPSQVAIDDIIKEVRAAAAQLGIELVDAKARSATELNTALGNVSKTGVDALYVVSDPVLGFERKHIVDFAANKKLPGIYFWREFAEIGGLASYGANLPDVYRRTAFYVDKILKGARPGDLPVEQPTKFELVINKRAAAQLGLTIPSEMLLRADDVIQ